jgi:hypothetical protein
MLHLAGDVIGIAAGFGQTSFVVAGHDRSAPVAARVGPFRPNTVYGCRSLCDYDIGRFQRMGYAGSLYWYRTSKLNWELTAAWHNAPLAGRSLFIGERDPQPDSAIARAQSSMPRTVLLDGSGHWAQQERLGQVNELLRQFLAELPDVG